MMQEVLGREPALKWDRWQVLNGVPAAVFGYFVSPEASRYSVCTVTRETNEQPVCRNTPHRGLVFAEPETGAVRRIVVYATGLGPADPVTAAGHVLDYTETGVGGRRHLLPAAAISFVQSGRREWREEIEYRRYRKFEAETTIRYEDKK
jgi:hypothetical protein